MSQQNPKMIAKQFCTAYYKTMQTNRPLISKFYRETSMLTFQGEEYKGLAAITGKLTSLGGKGEDDETISASVLYKLAKCDIQVSKARNSLVLLLVGKLSIDREDPIQFAHVVHLTTDDGAGWYIFNDIFRLMVGV